MKTYAADDWTESLRVKLLSLMPLKTYSHLVGLLAEVPIPSSWRGHVWSVLANRLGIELSEAETLINEYRTFGELFVRRLAPQRRVIDPQPQSIISPVDGCISAAGEINHQSLIQAKGIEYSLSDFFQDAFLAKEFEGGHFLTIYLRPKDYHRIHCPADAEVTEITHIPGNFFPVQPYVVRHKPGLFCINERLFFHLATRWGKIVLGCVAAAGVGNIATIFGTQRGKLDNMVKVDKGAELGAFMLGSTVVVVLPPGALELAPHDVGSEIRMGQKIASG